MTYKNCKRRWVAAIGSGVVMTLAMSAAPAAADSISAVEGARAKDRAGYYTTRQDREKLRRYGRNDDGYGYRGYDYGYSDAPYGGVSVYIGPPRYRYYDPYGY